MKTKVLLTIFLLLAPILCEAKKEINLIRFASCPGYKNISGTYKNIILTKNKEGKTVSISFDVIIKKEVKKMMLMVTMRKCESSENLDSCEYYIQDVKINNVCDIYRQKKQIWSEALSNSNFPRKCPIPAGTYNFYNTKLDDEKQLTLAPIPVGLWKIRVFNYDSSNDEVMVACLDLDVKVYRTRRN